MPDPILTCSSCGAEYDGADGTDCPACGSSSYAYDPADLDERMAAMP